MIPDPRIYVLLAIVAASFGAGWMVNGWKTDAEMLAVAETRKAAIAGAAEAIAKIKVTNTTVYQRATTKIIETPVYRECQHDQGMVEQINSALVPAP